MNSKHRYILTKLLWFEFLLLNVVLIVFLLLRYPEFSLYDPIFQGRIIQLITIYNLSWLFIVLFIRENEFYFNPNFSFAKNLIISIFCFVGVVITLIVLLKTRYYSRETYIVPIFIFLYLNLITQKHLLRYLKNKAAHLFCDTILVSSGKATPKSLAFTHAMAQYGYNVIGHLHEGMSSRKGPNTFSVNGGVEDLPEILDTRSVDEIFIDMTDMPQEVVAKTIDLADQFGVRVKLIPNNPLYIARNYKAVTVGELAVFKLRQSPLDNFNLTMLKRIFDFFFALTTLILLSPLFLLISALIYLDSGRPIFYTPYRKGEAGRTFKCYKFRTMNNCDNPLTGTKSTTVNDPRISRVGKILRKTDLDELPQFLNVLKGEMSVIGPRPHRINLEQNLRKCVSNYMVRSYIKPGITGWAQVNGWRGPTVTNEQKEKRIHHDLWYIENWSFWLDIKIIFLTIFGSHRKKAF